MKKLKGYYDRPLSAIDWSLFAFFGILCYFSFNQGLDLVHTGISSFAYLRGHFLDFYEYNKVIVGGNNYLPSTYIIYAIWNLPIHLLGLLNETNSKDSLLALYWFKLLPTLVYMASGYLVYRISLIFGLKHGIAKIAGFAFLTMPIGFFSQFIFGQYDIFTVFFMLLGLLFYYKKNILLFTVFMGIAVTFKYFPVLIFIPLLMLVEKDVFKIIKYSLILMLPLLLEVLIYLPSDAFRYGVFEFEANSYMFYATINLSSISLRIVIVLWILLAAYAYFTELKDDFSVIKWSIFFANIVTFLSFGLSMWHPQWLLFAVPFWVLGTMLSKKFDIFMVIEFMIMVFFILFTVNFFTNNVDQNMLNYGIFRDLIDGDINLKLTMANFFVFSKPDIIYSVFSSLLLVYVLFKHPKYQIEKAEDFELGTQGLLFMRMRFILGIGFFILPAFIILLLNLK
ncbi:MAG: hypothetical protein FD133_826 [Erysipelotrichaceae bacterium]|nr:MAG: hypothetical protein FD179_963 [Erysipelotrichaceae bacterium]TXT18464.1 MAG: hypothetical protein FD133_826 [Erysipelotrichaceae bacterium]